MATEFTDQFINGIETEGEAMNVINALRSKFGMVGTEFGEADIQGYAQSALSNHDEQAATFLEPHIIQAVQENSRWRRLSDNMVERGNDGIEDMVSAIVESISVGLSSPEGTVLVLAMDERGAVLQETKLNSDEELLVEIARAKGVDGVHAVKVGQLSTGMWPHENLLTIS